MPAVLSWNCRNRYAGWGGVGNRVIEAETRPLPLTFGEWVWDGKRRVQLLLQ